jgi:hypothetical protein
MSGPDDIAPLLAVRADAQLGFRQGTIVTFDPVTLEHTVDVGGKIFANLQILGVAEAASLRPGSVVGIQTVGNSWYIIGRMVQPGTDGATDAITLLGQRRHTATILTQEDTLSDTFTDLDTVGPTIADVLIPASGKIQLTLSALLNGNCVMSVAASGDYTEAPSLQRSLLIALAGLTGSSVLLYEGLTPGGRVTFTAKYRGDGITPAEFSNRAMIVEAV